MIDHTKSTEVDCIYDVPREKKNIAIVVSGQLRTGALELITALKDNFDDNIHVKTFFTTWNTQTDHKNHEYIIENYIDHVFEEPDVEYNADHDAIERSKVKLNELIADNIISGKDYDYYKSVVDNANKGYNRSKQILAHAKAVEHFNLTIDYDVIIRLRYDVILSQQFYDNLESWCDEVFNLEYPITHMPNLDGNTQSACEVENFGDIAIIHKADKFDVQQVYALHEEKQLLGSEPGWMQVLIIPYKKRNEIPSRNFSGFLDLVADENIPPGVKSFFSPSRTEDMKQEVLPPLKLPGATEFKLPPPKNLENDNKWVPNYKHDPKAEEVKKTYPNVPLKVAIIFHGMLPALGWCDPEENILKARELLPNADIFCTSWQGEKLKPFITKYYVQPKAHFNIGAPLVRNYIKLYRIFKDNDFDLKSLPDNFQNMTQEKAKDQIINTIKGRNKIRHQNKQQLLYALTYNDFIKPEHDIVIRLRYDSCIQDSLKDKIEEFCQLVWHTRRPAGFHHFTHSTKDIIFPKEPHEEDCHANQISGTLRDFMIIHRADMFDPNFVFHLWDTKRLHIAEQGWYQILSEPYKAAHRQYISYVKIAAQEIKEKKQRADFKRKYTEKELQDPEFWEKIDKSEKHAVDALHSHFPSHEKYGDFETQEIGWSFE